MQARNETLPVVSRPDLPGRSSVADVPNMPDVPNVPNTPDVPDLLDQAGKHPRRTQQKLREGFTTGTAATGAALAALDLLCRGNAPAIVSVPLPPFTALATPVASTPMPFAERCPRARLDVPIELCTFGPAPELATAHIMSQPSSTATGHNAADAGHGFANMAHASIRKDGGDDPDATSGALITATVYFRAAAKSSGITCACATAKADAAASISDMACMSGTACACDAASYPYDADYIRIEGGLGVGRVTLPGLPLPVGAAAINPVPQEQIRAALGEYLLRRLHKTPTAAPCPPLTVIISVPRGKEIARRTFNPRLGIVDGISILGTHGTVRPFSHAAWQATIEQGLQVALACGCRTVCLSTGRRSEKLLAARYPHLTEQSFIQAADFARASLRAAGALAFEQLVWGCFFGKLVKLAQGHAYTHARDATLDMAALADLCRKHNAGCADAVACCVTAAHALELLLLDPAGPCVITALAHQATTVAQGFAGRPVRLHLFHIDGRELYAP